jgi:hypothetical protein
VIDVPPPPPVEVTHHRMFKGWCTQCQTWHEAPVDVHTEVLRTLAERKGPLTLVEWYSSTPHGKMRER